jgi:hypothetical protein
VPVIHIIKVHLVEIIKTGKNAQKIRSTI